MLIVWSFAGIEKTKMNCFLKSLNFCQLFSPVILTSKSNDIQYVFKPYKMKTNTEMLIG